jgi:cytochrome P450
MSTSNSESKLANAFSSVSARFRGTDVDLHAVCREMRHKSPVYEGDFIATLGVPTNAKVGLKLPTVALFRYQDVMAVLRDAENYTSGFIAQGLGAAFDGLIILAMDGDEHRRVRSLLQPVFMPASVNRWRDKIDQMIR